jgi:hypothetical protein
VGHGIEDKARWYARGSGGEKAKEPREGQVADMHALSVSEGTVEERRLSDQGTGEVQKEVGFK